MRLLGDWKWNAALAIFALCTAFVVFWPGPGSKPSGAPATTTAQEPHGTATNLPSAAEQDPTPAEYDAMLQYTVQEGDTAAGIARLFVISAEDLLRANHIRAGGEVTPGAIIRIPQSQ